jgi:hypothetical protein
MLEPTDEAWGTELMSRESNGITVGLRWSRATNLVTVAEFRTRRPEPEMLRDAA